MKKIIKFIFEWTNDSSLKGGSFFNLDFANHHRSFFGLFWHKEERNVWLEILWLRIILRVQ